MAGNELVDVKMGRAALMTRRTPSFSAMCGPAIALGW
jgi:hypothetical protein